MAEVTKWLEAAINNVLPSGDALETKAVPMAPPAPGLLSMIQFCPVSCDSSC